MQVAMQAFHIAPNYNVQLGVAVGLAMFSLVEKNNNYADSKVWLQQSSVPGSTFTETRTCQAAKLNHGLGLCVALLT